MKSPITILLLLLTFLSSVHASTSQDSLDKLRVAMKRVIDGKKLTEGGEPNMSYEMQALYQQTGQIRSHIEQGDTQFMQEVLGRVGMVFSSPGIADLAEKAQEELTQEQKDQQQHFVENTEKTIKETVATAMKAQTSAEIDALLTTLPKRNDYGSNNSREVQEEMNKLQNARNFLTKWQDYLHGRETSDLEKQRQALNEMVNYEQYQAFVPRSKLLEMLSQIESARKNGIVNSSAGETSLQHALDALFDDILKAKSLEDLDAPSQKFRAFKAANYTAMMSDSAAQQESRAIESFLDKWQSFLTAWDEASYSVASEMMDNYLAQNMDLQFLPKGKITEAVRAVRSQPVKMDTSVALVREIKTLEDIQPALAKWSAQNAHVGVSPPSLVQALTKLNDTYQQIKAGLPYSGQMAAPMSYPAVYPNDLSELAPLKAQLVIFAAPRILNLGQSVTPNTGETASDFLHRLVDQARRSGDSDRLMDAQQFLTDVESGFLRRQDDSLTGKYAVIAERMENGGLYALAVFYYALATREAPKDYSLDRIHEALEKIKKEHAADYETGQQNFITTATNNYPGAYLPNPMMLFNSDPSLRNMSPFQRMQMMRSMYMGNPPTSSSTPASPGTPAPGSAYGPPKKGK